VETRANHVWVGAITLALLAALAAFIVWLTGLSAGDQRPYDIFFKQSVNGLAKGSQVNFSGVPAGQVSDISLWQKNPEFVRVRISVNKDIPILIGTTATIQATFTGVSSIQLDGAVRGAPPITCENTNCTEGVPEIPAKQGGLGEILASAPLLLERLATLTERLTQLLSDDNQASIAGILRNTDRMTEAFASAAPQTERVLNELQATLRQANYTLAAFEKTLGTTDRVLNEEGGSLARQLRETLKSAGAAADALKVTLDESRPATKQFTESTLPAAEATLRDLRATSAALRAVTEKIDNQGAGALFKGQSLPDYKP
jgi:phospholipid/cholesterol/gamma-HCH transport system substrate-binding protein